MFKQQKSPAPFGSGASDQDDASFDYARTPPEPPEGLVLVVVLVVADNMGTDLWARLDATSISFARKSVNAGLIRTP
jgi:hypothetical protein